MSKNIDVRVEKLKAMRAAYFHALSDTPEEDAWKKAESWARKKGLIHKNSKVRVFGGNSYPTVNPEPHGYGFFITITPDVKVESEISVRLISGGLYGIARCKGLEQIVLTFTELMKWVDNSKYQYIGETKGEHGYEIGFEEIINWYSFLVEKSKDKIILDLMLQLWEE